MRNTIFTIVIILILSGCKTKMIQFHATEVLIPENISFADENIPIDRIDIREALEREIITNTYLHSSTIQILKKTERYFAIIEPMLKKAGIPDDFKYLAIAESGLRDNATSYAGAKGIWQFMPKTAEEYGLIVNKEVDERLNIEKATIAATEYLNKAYEIFGSWTLAAATYNAGMRRIQESAKEQNVDDYNDLYLNEETARYIFRILAFKQILNNPEKYGFAGIKKYVTEKTTSIEINSGVENWVDFAEKNNVSYKTLKRFNPWIKGFSLTNKEKLTFKILIPLNIKRYE